MSNKKHKIKLLPVHSGKSLKELIQELIRMDLTPEDRKAYDQMLEAHAFSEFAAIAARGIFKKSGSSILVNIVAQDIKQRAACLRRIGVDGKTHPAYQHLGIIEKAEHTGDVAFFKSLGRTLEKNKSGAWGWRPLGRAMLELMWQKPGISGEDAERELKKQKKFGHATAENFNKFYNRVRASLPPEWQHQFPKRKPGRP